jgi:hypothetical protein
MVCEKDLKSRKQWRDEQCIISFAFEGANRRGFGLVNPSEVRRRYICHCTYDIAARVALWVAPPVVKKGR